MASEQPPGPTATSSGPQANLVPRPEDRPEQARQNTPAPHRQSPANAESGPSSSSHRGRPVNPQAENIDVERDDTTPRANPATRDYPAESEGGRRQGAAAAEGPSRPGAADMATSATSMGLGAGRPLPPPPPRSPSPRALNAGQDEDERYPSEAPQRHASARRDENFGRQEAREREAADPFASREGSMGDPIQTVPDTHPRHAQTGASDRRESTHSGEPYPEHGPHNYRNRFIGIAGDLLEETIRDDEERPDQGPSSSYDTRRPGQEHEGLGARIIHLAADYAGNNMHRIRLPQVLTPRVGTGTTPRSPNPDHGRSDYFGQSPGSTSRRRDQSLPASPGPILRTPGETPTARTPRVIVDTPGGRSHGEHAVEGATARNAELPPLPTQQQRHPEQQVLHESPVRANIRDSSSTDPTGPLVTPHDNQRVVLAEPPVPIRIATDNNFNGEPRTRRNSALRLPSMPPRATTWDNGNANQYSPEHRNGSVAPGGLSRQRTLETRRSVAAPSIIDHTVPVQVELLDEKCVPGTVNARIHSTIKQAREQRDKYAVKAKWTGWALNIAIGLQVLLGSLTTGLSAVAVNGRSAAVATTILGALATLVASYLARARGSNEPELSITRVKDLEQFIREVENFRMDHGFEMGDKYDSRLDEYRRRFEELLGNANGERKLSNTGISGSQSWANRGNGP